MFSPSSFFAGGGGHTRLKNYVQFLREVTQQLASKSQYYFKLVHTLRGALGKMVF